MSQPKFLITDRDGYYELNGRMNTVFGYPTVDGQTLTYSEPLVHPGDGRYAIIIQDRCIPYLIQSEVDALVDQAALIADNWYPTR